MLNIFRKQTDTLLLYHFRPFLHNSWALVPPVYPSFFQAPLLDITTLYLLHCVTDVENLFRQQKYLLASVLIIWSLLC